MGSVSQSQSRSGRKSAIVVDEHPLIVEALAMLIPRHTSVASVTGVRSPEEALRLIARNQPDVLVTELTFHVGSGLELLAQLRAQHPQVRSLVFSARTDVTAALRSIQLGAYGFVCKSDSIEVVLNAIRRTLGGQTSIDDELSEALERASKTDADRSSEDPVSRLSRWEYEVYVRIGKGMSSREIAKEVERSVKTVETYKTRIKRKLGLTSSLQLARHAFMQTG